MINKVKELVENELNKNNISLNEILYVVEDNINYLRIILNSNDLDTCIKASNIINPILDENNITDDNYVLDVCTKGGID